VVEGALGDAFRRMGIQSSEAIRATAQQASADFIKIRDSGVAAPSEIEKAFKKAQEAVRAAIATMVGDSQKHLEKIKELTAAVQVAATATVAKGKAVEAAANAQKAETEYANASAEAGKTGSAAAKAKADALGLAAKAAQAESVAAQASAQAAEDAVKATKAEASAKEALALHAKSGTEATRAMAAEAQINANASAVTAEKSKQAATEAGAMAGELRSSAAAAMTLAGTVQDAAESMSRFKKEAYDASGYLLDADGQKFESAAMTAEGFAAALKAAKEEALKLGEASDKMIDRAVEAARQVTNAGVDGVNAFAGAQDQVQEIAQQLAKTELAQRRNAEAAAAWQSALVAAKSAAGEIKNQLDQALGRFDQMERRDFEMRMSALRAQMEEARNSGNGQAVGELARAMADLRQLHAIKMENIAKEKAAQITADKEQNEKAAADKAAALLDASKNEAVFREKTQKAVATVGTMLLVKPADAKDANDVTKKPVEKPKAAESQVKPPDLSVYKPPTPDLSAYLPREFTRQYQQAQSATRHEADQPSRTVRIQFIAPGGASVTGRFENDGVEAMLAALKAAGARAVPG